MKKEKIIEQLIQTNQVKQFEKPRYPITNLYIGKILKPFGRDLKMYVPVKDFAICTFNPIYFHKYHPIDETNLPYKYIVANTTPLKDNKEIMQMYNLFPCEKLSLKQIIEIEKELNKNQEYTIIFN